MLKQFQARYQEWPQLSTQNKNPEPDTELS